MKYLKPFVNGLSKRQPRAKSDFPQATTGLVVVALFSGVDKIISEV
jgi:hypothetical protein